MYNHHIIDLTFGSERQLINLVGIRKILLECCEISGVSVLHDYFHRFDDTNGFTGIICLAESHISIHTWPEKSKMYIDVFICNDECSNTFMKLLTDKLIMSAPWPGSWQDKCIKHDIRTIERM
jgi:S-adenosylmethionine decarboxylase